MGITLGCGDPASAGGPESLGSTTGAVVGGWAANDRQIFATVEIRRAGAGSGFCSGALISPMVVATAAHCAVVEPSPGVVQPAAPGSLEVAAGHLRSAEAEPSMTRPVYDVSIHEDYDHDFIMGRSRTGAGQGGIGSPNDIALLFLATPFDDVPSAPVLSHEQERELVHHGDVGFVAGYGVYDLEQKLTGELYISDAVIDILGAEELLTRRIDQLGDSCYGDSGGPLYIPTEHGNYLVGLVSRGRSDVRRDCGDGGVYTLLSAHLPWIASAAGSRFQPANDSIRGTESFLAEGADPIELPDGRSLHRSRSCAASPSNVMDSSPLQLVALLTAFVLARRRLSVH